jgi:hypothetical protein
MWNRLPADRIATIGRVPIPRGRVSLGQRGGRRKQSEMEPGPARSASALRRPSLRKDRLFRQKRRLATSPL